ncbi:MAG: PaaX family transcriptional regulator [Acidimicrobiales bacterium]
MTSSRSYLLTILGEFVLPSGGAAWTATLIDGLVAVGVEDRTARQTIARVADRGLLRSERSGRRVRWHLTEPGRVLLAEGARRIYSLHHEPHWWDGRWLLVFSTVPEARRELRHRLRSRFEWAGFAGLGPGVWVSPWVDHEHEVKAILAELGLSGSARSFVGGIGGIGDARRLVAEAWDLESIGVAYAQFMERHRRRRPAGAEECFSATTELVDDWRRFPFLDPDLPPELLPRGWSGHRAATLFHRLHDRWSPAATDWWRDRAAAADAG